MNDANSKFQRQLRQFRTLTVVGYLMTLLICVGMVVAGVAFPQNDSQMPTALPVLIVGFVLMLAIAMPCIWAAYDKTTCPHCGKRIEDGHFYWHGIKLNGPTRRYWKLFWGRLVHCPHCNAEVTGVGRARTPYPPSVSEPRSGGYRGAAPQSGSNAVFVG